MDMWPIPFHNDDPINAQLDNTGKIIVALQPTPPLHSFVYPISEEKSSAQSNLLMIFKWNMWWGMNVMNDGKLILWFSNDENEMQFKI